VCNCNESYFRKYKYCTNTAVVTKLRNGVGYLILDFDLLCGSVASLSNKLYHLLYLPIVTLLRDIVCVFFLQGVLKFKHNLMILYMAMDW